MAFMTHPEHGAINVGSGEVADHEKLGWKVTTHEEWLGSKLKKPEPKDSEIEELRNDLDSLGISYDKRWGVEKLRNALEEATS